VGGGVLPGRLRTLALLAVLLVVHLTLSKPLESLRLLLCRMAFSPLAPLGSAAPDARPVLDEADALLVASAQAGLRARAAAARDEISLLPVLDLDTTRGRLILGGGRRAGVRWDALVFSGGVCVGIVDRVLPHLSRVLLLHARGARLPVRVEGVGRKLPGGLLELHGVLGGDGERCRLQKAFLPEEFRAGDRLVTLEDEGRPSVPVGRVVTTGVRPEVALSTSVRGASLLGVDGAVTPPEVADLFEEKTFRVLYVARGRHHGAVIQGEGAGSLLSGSAVHAAGILLGVVTGTGPGAAAVRPVTFPGQRLTVRLIREDGASCLAVLEGGGGEGCRVAAWIDEAWSDQDVLVVTAGGQDLVPPWLVLGRGRLHEGGLELKAPRTWPARVVVSVFRHGGERGRLLGRGS